ncbi:hypothetical protein N7466_001332 [Penicillium verhagenii]|uniref:uncharacterized protein n=1 Tax=Penicillium verhagenii TaxID=1562060 RepID=UPI002544F99D|nr:uncharacterized protein N7466_001332 [Penicillium verhagenii]KAJ5948317.1 hypothetical protein N7466_001332 [Penicillium verhagenii]
MGTPVGLQPQALLVHPAALAKHLQNMVKKDPSHENLNSIDSHLLNLAHAEAIPSYVYRVWLFTSWKHLPNGRILLAALRDQTSAGIRKAGIKLVQHIFRKPSRKALGWDRLGGSQGIKAVLDELPLVQVRLFISAISQTGQESDRELFATFFDELVTLIEESDPWTTRSLSRHVALLYARCSLTKVMEILSSGIPSSLTFTRDVSRLHSHLLRQIAIGVVKIPSDVRRHILETCTEMLLKSNEPYDPIHATDIYSGNFPGLKFGVDLLLQIRAGEPDLRTSPSLMRQCTELILSIAIRRRLPFASILPIINLSLEMCQAADSSDWLSRDLPKDVIRCWSMARFGRYGSTKPFHAAMKKSGASSPSQPRPVNQAELQICLIENVLQVREDRLSTQSGQQEFTRQLTHLISNVHMDGRLEFLQLICRHSPSLNFDLTAWPPSEEEKKLVPIWENRLLSMLPGPSSKILFQRSLYIHNCDTFLTKNLVEQNAWLLSWEQQCSLWASWEFLIAATSDDFVVTRKGI